MLEGLKRLIFNTDIDDVGRLQFLDDLLHLVRTHALGIARADDTAHRGTGKEARADTLFLQSLQKADVRDAARPARAQRKPKFFTHKISSLPIIV